MRANSRSPLPGLVASLAHIGADPADGDEVRLRKALLVSSTPPINPAGVLRGALCFLLLDKRASALAQPGDA
jgi:hypothetical protein